MKDEGLKNEWNSPVKKTGIIINSLGTFLIFVGPKVEVSERQLEKYVEDSNFSLLVKDNCNQVSSIYNNGG